ARSPAEPWDCKKKSAIIRGLSADILLDIGPRGTLRWHLKAFRGRFFGYRSHFVDEATAGQAISFGLRLR
ncbi:MAG TPA: hypothetical protein PK458_10830, partial [Phycisphaerae bacterium]|nr:hypothetical protein [Phycisphaerae bacterium]